MAKYWRYQKKQKCLDGKFRSDCVVMHDRDEFCGKPMIGVVKLMDDWWARMCAEHFPIWTTNNHISSS